MMYDLYKKNNSKLDLLNFNIFGSSEYEKKIDIFLKQLNFVSLTKNSWHNKLIVYEHWTDKWKYIPYISVAQTVLKSCGSKMATLAHDVCDAYGTSLLYIKTCWESSFIYIYIYIKELCFNSCFNFILFWNTDHAHFDFD